VSSALQCGYRLIDTATIYKVPLLLHLLKPRQHPPSPSSSPSISRTGILPPLHYPSQPRHHLIECPVLQNEVDVAAALALHSSATSDRDGVFVTSKVSPYDLGYDKCLESIKVRLLFFRS
jgi:hypothetical protein